MPQLNEAELRRRIAAALHKKQAASIPLEFGARISAATAESDGWVWPVVVCKSGWGGAQILGIPEFEGKPQYIPREVLPQIAKAVNGARFRRRHPLDHEGNGDSLPDLVAGWVDNGRVAGDEVWADIHLLANEHDLRARLVAARDAGQMQLFNLSIYAFFAMRLGTVEGRSAVLIERLGRVVGLDLCGEPGWGGKFLSMRLAASLGVMDDTDSPDDLGEKNGRPVNGARRINGGAMKPRIIALLAALATFAQERATKLREGLDALPEAELPKRFEDVVDAFVECSNGVFVGANTGADGDPALIKRVAAALEELQRQVTENRTAAGSEALVKANEALDEAKKIQSGNLLNRKLAEAKLPAEAETIVRAHLDGRVVEEKDIDAEITTVRAAFAQFTEVGRVTDAGGVSVGRETADKLQLAMDSMFGVKAAVEDKDARPFRGLQEAYLTITGDREFRFDKGGLYRVRAAMTTATLPDLLLNSMTKRLIQDYKAIGWKGLERWVRFVGVTDFKTQHRVRLGYFPDLSTVAEDAAYTEIANPSDDLIQYAVSKRGNLFTLTEEMIRNDDLRKLLAIPERVARAGIRTGKQFVTNFFASPGNYDGDGVAAFHASHGNLGSVAISDIELDAREVALFNQAEPDSSKTLGLVLDMIMIPIQLKSTAYQINNNDDGSNSWYGRFGSNRQAPEGITVNEQLADVNDWLYGASELPCIEVGVLDGADGQPPIPQILIANEPTQGAAFTNDRVQYKTKMVFGGDYTDFRGIGKNVVA